MDANVLGGIAGFVLSLVFAYVPKVQTWYAQKDPNTKRGIMAIALAVSAIGVFSLSCLGWLSSLWPGLQLACTQDGALSMVRIFFVALIANQSTYPILPVSKKVAAIKASKKMYGTSQAQG